MNPRLAIEWDAVRRSFWLVPALMSGAAVVLSFLTVAIDHSIDPPSSGYLLLFAGEPEGARAVLAATAGSMITVAGVVFSITIVALTIASSQFGPRIVRSFTRDVGNQVVLGTFISTFLYSLLVLRTVRGGVDEFVPHLSVTVALLLVLASVGVLIYFVHHAAWSLSPSRVVRSVASELDTAAARLSRNLDQLNTPAESAELAPDDAGAHDTVASDGDGYVQWVDVPALVAIASERDLSIRARRRAGDHVLRGETLAEVWSADSLDHSGAASIGEAFILGPERTVEQDVEFALEQLAAIAVRALSTGVNDPFTATDSIDRLTVSLVQLASRQPLPNQFCDDAGDLRVETVSRSLPHLIAAAFNPIRLEATVSAAVATSLFDALARIAAVAADGDSRDAVRRQARLVEAAARAQIDEQWDLEQVLTHRDAVLQSLRDPIDAAAT